MRTQKILPFVLGLAGLALGLLLSRTGALQAEAPAAAGEPRTIAIEVTDAGYDPDKLELVASETVWLAFHSETDSECSGSVQSEDLGIAPTRLPKGKTTVIEIKAPKEGKYSFACSMSMNTGTVVVKGS